MMQFSSVRITCNYKHIIHVHVQLLSIHRKSKSGNFHEDLISRKVTLVTLVTLVTSNTHEVLIKQLLHFQNIQFYTVHVCVIYTAIHRNSMYMYTYNYMKLTMNDSKVFASLRKHISKHGRCIRTLA